MPCGSYMTETEKQKQARVAPDLVDQMSCADRYGVGEDVILDEDMDPEEMLWEFCDKNCLRKE